MNKHGWRMLSGFIMLVCIAVPYKIIRYIISYGDQFWNDLLWQPLLGKSLPLVGFILSIIVVYLIGAVNETKFGAWLHEKIISRVPIAGSLLSSFNPKSREVLQKAKGFILAPFWDGYRPAKLTAVLKKKSGYFGVVTYLTTPPTVQTLEDSTLIYALEIVEKDGIKYGVIPTDTSVRLELSAGTTVPADALANAEKIPLGKFLRSYQFINNGEKEAPKRTNNN